MILSLNGRLEIHTFLFLTADEARPSQTLNLSEIEKSETEEARYD